MESHSKTQGVTTADVEHRESFHTEEPKVTAIDDGDDALKILHTHYEPSTKEEEKRLVRKIDLRLALLMLVVNGLQFVDKLVVTFQ